MRKSALLLTFMAAICVGSANGKPSAELTAADWLSAAKAALQEGRTNGLTFVVDDALAPEARNALESLRKVVALAHVPDQQAEVSAPEDYMRVLQFRAQGERIEFLEGSVYPKVYRPGDCRFTIHLFLARAADGEWKQDGPSRVHICSRH